MPTGVPQRDLAKELEDEKEARQQLHYQFDLLRNNIARINGLFIYEANARTTTINEIAEENRRLTAWLNERSEKLEREKIERQQVENSLKADLERQQRVLEDERLARQTDKHQHSRELEDKIAKLTRDFEN